MEYIYYCKKCKRTFSSMVRDSDFNCPDCNVRMVATEFPSEVWRAKSDEEKAALKQEFENKATTSSTQSSDNANHVGVALSVAGWIYIVASVIGAFIIAYEVSEVVGILAGVFGFLSGLLLLGFGEVVNLLQDIKNK